MKAKVVIIGAGPAGLTAGYLLLKIQTGRRLVDRDFAERHAHAPAFIADFLRRQVFFLSIEADRSVAQAGRLQIDFMRSFMVESASVSDPNPAEFRRMGEQSVLKTAV